MESKNKGMTSTVKSTKKPVIRQTLTSIYRMAKANPLMVSNSSIQIDKTKKLTLPNAVTRIDRRQTLDFRDSLPVGPKLPGISASLGPLNNKLTKPTARMTSIGFKAQTKPSNEVKRTTLAAIHNNKQQKPLNVPKMTQINRKHDVKGDGKPRSIFPKMEQKKTINNVANKVNLIKKNEVKTAHKAPIKKVSNIKPEMKKVIAKVSLPAGKPVMQPMRRSLSAQFYERRLHKHLPKPERNAIRKDDTQSMENLSNIEESPIKKTISFKSPSAYRRRSSGMPTPDNPINQQTKQPTPYPKQYNELQKPLIDWLRKKGKSLSTFHHLKCFGLTYINDTDESDVEDEENKENIEKMERTESYDGLHIVCDDDSCMNEEKKVHVKDALNDLHKLITEGYPLSQCELWLGFIREKYKLIEEEPHYWECRAAIEQARGNITSAVDYYKTSIIKGAEVDHIDESLNHLLEKFSLLNIETTLSNPMENKRRGKQLEEVRNIFKSSIIQFAVQERAMKKSIANGCDNSDDEKIEYFATPVRRSTRKSRIHFTSTPGLKTYNSLHELDESVQSSLSFKSNGFIK